MLLKVAVPVSSSVTTGSRTNITVLPRESHQTFGFPQDIPEDWRWCWLWEILMKTLGTSKLPGPAWGGWQGADR